MNKLANLVAFALCCLAATGATGTVLACLTVFIAVAPVLHMAPSA